MKFFPPCLFLAVFLLGAVTVSASVPGHHIFGVVSDRSASALASGAAAFLDKHQGYGIVLRTPSQLRQMSDQEIARELAKASVISAAAFFGDQVARFAKLVEAHAASKVFYAVSSAPQLVKLSRNQKTPVFAGMSGQYVLALTKSLAENETLRAWLERMQKQYPGQHRWLALKAYWQGRGRENMLGFLEHAAAAIDATITPVALVERPGLRVYSGGRFITDEAVVVAQSAKGWIAIIDHDTGDRAGDIDTVNRLCAEAETKGMQCLAFFARWGETSTAALKKIADVNRQFPVAGIISLQDFVIGGGEGRLASLGHIAEIGVPVLKAIRVTDRTEAEWRYSDDGLAWDSVHYRIAMPELQGIGQPLVVAAASPEDTDPVTGVRLTQTLPIDDQIGLAISRIDAWRRLRHKQNADKKVAIIYYNHPPGRHNIGADNLDVPASLYEMLTWLREAGYRTGELPESPAALLRLIQEKATNLPEDRQAITAMAAQVTHISTAAYETWLGALPASLQAEMVEGPLGYLNAQLTRMLAEGEVAAAKKLAERVSGDIEHVLGGVRHPAKDRALRLLHQLQAEYERATGGEPDFPEIDALTQALTQTGIEGLRGWGLAPGKVMVHAGNILLPGLRFGNIFIGPQPPRGWELDEELLHANMSFPPPHQYLAFYLWLQKEFQADALVHVGRHSTYEFLPRRGVGVGASDYPLQIASTIPGIYPYIVDGVGEGIQAKRRGLAIMVDHLTPPLGVTPLYDDLLRLRQLVESYEASGPDSAAPAKARALAAMRDLIATLNLKEELSASMDEELQARGISFEEADGEFLVHEVGHYLTQLQEDFMPRGLHIFGREWDPEAVQLMLASISDGDDAKSNAFRLPLQNSPKAERTAFLNALNGAFVEPGKGNDPIRTPEALPTGRNFYALDSSVLPTRLGYAMGQELAVKAVEDNETTQDGREAVILWASDTVRDEGAMIAFGLDLLGIKPVWNTRGIVTGIERLPLTHERRRRLDTVFISSGLFRDLYGQQLVLLDKAVLLALDGSSRRIRSIHPDLISALDQALAPLGALATGGAEPIETNDVAAHWIADTQQEIAAGTALERAGERAALRLFGAAPGTYGAGVNRLVERSGAWEKREELGAIYIARMGHAYSTTRHGVPAHTAFKRHLSSVRNTYLGRASNLYGLLDNNDAFDYLGGLSLAVETLTGKTPENKVIHHADPENASLQPLTSALLRELRGRFLNPEWLEPLMEHGYAGARTMGSEFIEYLWGWQVTNPDIITSRVWDEVDAVYLQDRYDIDLDRFLEEHENIHVKINIEAIMLVAAQRGFWQANDERLEDLAGAFANKILTHGLPGSGHTTPDHPVFHWVMPKLAADMAEALRQLLDDTRIADGDADAERTPTRITEINLEDSERTDSPEKDAGQPTVQDIHSPTASQYYWLILLIFLLIATGIWRGRRVRKET